jgi:hypothetical protein
MFRFRMAEGEDKRITFLDGKLDADGMLDIPMYREHMVKINGGWQNFVCTAEADQTQPCPLCEAGDRSSLVGVMTIVDHTPHKIKNGPKAGQVISNTRKMFPAKPQTLKVLTTLAKKRGGVSGCTFDVSRIGDNSASVGSQFDFVEKFNTRSAIAQKFGLKEEDVQPADYGAEIRYYTPQELIDLGVGKGVKASSYAGASSNLNDEL